MRWGYWDLVVFLCWLEYLAARDILFTTMSEHFVIVVCFWRAFVQGRAGELRRTTTSPDGPWRSTSTSVRKTVGGLSSH
jgi:hypothetical protein